jgi:hypothetical protein
VTTGTFVRIAQGSGDDYANTVDAPIEAAPDTLFKGETVCALLEGKTVEAPIEAAADASHGG